MRTFTRRTTLINFAGKLPKSKGSVSGRILVKGLFADVNFHENARKAIIKKYPGILLYGYATNPDQLKGNSNVIHP